MTEVVLIKGDGIGPEISDAVVEIFDAAQVPLRWIEKEAGLGCTSYAPSGLPDETVKAVADYGMAIKGPTTTPIGSGHKSVNVTLRKKLDLYANVRPSRSLPGVETRFKNVDLIIVRENIEDTYAGIEHMQTPDVAQTLKLITRPGSLKIARYAFEMARQSKRQRVVCVHKANIHKISDGLFLEAFREVSKDYPDIQASDMLVDNCCMQLATRPEQFDVLVTMNLYGDILSDLCAGIVGGLGVAPGGNIGDKHAIFEAVHGSAPDIAGQGLANPTALLLSGIMMLQHLGLLEASQRVQRALDTTMRDGIKTRDLGGNAGTKEFTKAIIDRMETPQHSVETSVNKPNRIVVSGEKLTVSGKVSEEIVGTDIFVRWDDGLPPLPKESGNLELAIISNRGTKVYPGEIPDILLVNHYRCRYKVKPGTAFQDSDVVQLLSLMSEQGITWMHLEKLYRFNDQDSYSKAQGE